MNTASDVIINGVILKSLSLSIKYFWLVKITQIFYRYLLDF